MSKQQGQTPDVDEISKKSSKKYKTKYEWEIWSKRIKGSDFDYLFFKDGLDPGWMRHSKYKTERDVDQAMIAIQKSRWWNSYWIYEKRNVK